MKYNIRQTTPTFKLAARRSALILAGNLSPRCRARSGTKSGGALGSDTFLKSAITNIATG